MRIPLFKTLPLLLPCASIAGEADILAAEVESVGGEFYRFKVTVQHDDEDWNHYAQRWEILSTDGKLLAIRVLRHPHINEQPFTRSVTAIIPEDIDQVVIRAYDLVHEFGGKEFTLNLNKENQNEFN